MMYSCDDTDVVIDIDDSGRIDIEKLDVVC